MLHSIHYKVLNIHPYCPDLALCEVNVFCTHMYVLKVSRSWSCEDVKTVVLHWLQQQPRKFFIVGIHWLVSQWDACISIHVKLLLMDSTPLLKLVLEGVSHVYAIDIYCFYSF